MLLIEYVGHIGLWSLIDGHFGRHLEYFKTLNDARVASVGFIKYNTSTTWINKEINFKIKFQVILVFYRTMILVFLIRWCHSWKKLSKEMVMLIGPRREKTCLRGFANNKSADQPAHPRSLISAFVIRVLESIISRLAMSEISIY